MIRAVVMEPGKWAEKKDLEPSTQVIRDLVGGSFYVHRPRPNGVVIIGRDVPEGYVLRANRQAVCVNGVRGGFYHGTIIAIGIDRDLKTFRSLTKDELKRVMKEYGRPHFPDYPQYGLEPGEEVKVVSKHKLHPMQEGEPERLVVVREYPYFIQVTAHVRYEDGEEHCYPICINKADLISTDTENPLKVIRCRTGKRLK